MIWHKKRSAASTDLIELDGDASLSLKVQSIQELGLYTQTA